MLHLPKVDQSARFLECCLPRDLWLSSGDSCEFAAIHNAAEVRETIVREAMLRAKALFLLGKILNDEELATLESISAAGVREEATLRAAASARAQCIGATDHQWLRDLSACIAAFRGSGHDAQRHGVRLINHFKQPPTSRPQALAAFLVTLAVVR